MTTNVKTRYRPKVYQTVCMVCRKLFSYRGDPPLICPGCYKKEGVNG